MRIPSNKTGDISRFFREELKNEYSKEEIARFIAFCFEEYAGIREGELAVNTERTVSESELLKLNTAVKALRKHVPIQYILGKADFFGMKFYVDGHVLIPRPETEELVDLILKETKDVPMKILDIGTGSGCIPVALKINRKKADVFAMDVSEEALAVAKKNAVLNNAEIHFFQADIFSESVPEIDRIRSDQGFDLIVSNPPYIAVSEQKDMEKNVLDHEPHLALFVNDADPLLFYRVIAEKAREWLRPGGALYFEINEKLGGETQHVLLSSGFKNVELLKDLNNKNRILRGNNPE